jgi:predicted aspartyl protease
MNFPIRAILICSFSAALAGQVLAECSLMKMTQMPLVELGGHYAVVAQINTAMRPIIVDTGAEVTMFTLKAAEDLKLTPDEASRATLKPTLGIGQTSADLHLNVMASVLGLGDLIYHNRSTVVAPMDFGQKPESAAIGLLGDDILSQYEVEFDFISKVLTFYSPLNCYDSFIPWTGSYSTIPFDHHGAKIVVDVVFNDERVRAIVDTGNNMSFISRKSPALWNVTDDQLTKTKAQSTSPMNGGTSLPIDLYTFDKIKIGNESFAQKTIGTVDVDLITGSANLGMDYFKGRKLWISYRNEVMFMSRPQMSTRLAYPVLEQSGPPAATGQTKTAEGDDESSR